MARRWTVQDSADLYHIHKWGAPYFTVTKEGHLACRPQGEGGASIDVKRLVDHLRRRDINPPLLIRFNDLLGARVAELARAFEQSRKEYGFEGTYIPAMPIKVNQQRHVIEEILRQGASYSLCLEAGSKPEVLAAMGVIGSGNPTLICNGYKDVGYIETALLGQRLGLQPIIVVDRFDELPLILDVAERMEMRPHIGVRVKLSTRGSGKWEESSGDHSKFGLSMLELVQAIDLLKDRGALDALKLLHFHIGSQITAIRSVKEAVREAARVYCELRASGAAELSYIDVGGGLAIDYDGSQTNFHSSRNYSIQEYANDIVWGIFSACDETKQPHPTIITESGRALVAHHSVLVFNVLGSAERAPRPERQPAKPTASEHDVVHGMWDAFDNVSKKTYQESYHDAVLLKEETATLFAHGVIDLRTRARVEELFWATLSRIQRTVRQLDYVPDDLEDLDVELADTYFCNFSVFQSLPDHWAVKQLFPIAPLHRLDEEPSRDAVLADLTCDSDGRVDQFIDLRDVKDTLKLHALNGAPYHVGVFLVGAYQETLGDLHNLFGDTNAVHVSLDEDGSYRLDHLVTGDQVDEVLSYVEYRREDLLASVRQSAEKAVREGLMTFEQSADLMRRYEQGLKGYTYLEHMD